MGGLPGVASSLCSPWRTETRASGISYRSSGASRSESAQPHAPGGGWREIESKSAPPTLIPSVTEAVNHCRPLGPDRPAAASPRSPALCPSPLNRAIQPVRWLRSSIGRGACVC